MRDEGSLSLGMWMYGSGPPAAKVERLSTVKTGCGCERESYAENMRFTIYDGDFMGRIDIQRTTIQGECDRVVVQCRISGRVVLEDPSINRSDSYRRHSWWGGSRAREREQRVVVVEARAAWSVIIGGRSGEIATERIRGVQIMGLYCGRTKSYRL